MGVFDEYINSLEGQSELDIVEVTSKLHELHKQETEPLTAKISDLNANVESLNGTITDKDREIDGWKLKNYDLVMQLPAKPDEPKLGENPDGKHDPATITIDDLFESKE